MKNLKVTNLMKNDRSIANQFLIYYSENGKLYKIFQSYSSIILKWENGILIEVGANWKHSHTTSKYRNILTFSNTKEFEKLLKNEFKYNEYTNSYLRKKGENGYDI